MCLAAKIFTSAYFWIFALFRLGCAQDVFKSRQVTDVETSTPQSTSSYLPPLRVAARLLNQSSCSAPPQPENGEWRLDPDLCAKDSANCGVFEGSELRLGYQLIYNCTSGYKIEGNDKVYCTARGELSSIPSCREILCDILSKDSRNAECSRSGKWVDCRRPVPLNTMAKISCNPGYKEAGEVPVPSDVAQKSVVKCNDDGNWDPPPIRCVPVVRRCGRPKPNPNAYGGWVVTERDQFPWQATLYKEIRSRNGTIKMFICGATIIKVDFVMTAAHCVYDETTRETEDAKKLYVMVGNLLRDYDHPENVESQRSVVRQVYLPFDYYGLRGNYGSDIALLELQEPIDTSSTVVSACLSTLRPDTQVLRKGAIGKVAGFGRSETDDSSPTLQAITAPYVPYTECAAPGTTADNYVFITKDKFCAGYTNGTVACDGDSGGGLVFESNGRSFVMGIVSVSLGVDLSNGERTCSKHALTLYTKVSEYIDWIKEVLSDPQQSKQGPSSISNSQSSPEDSAASISPGTSSGVVTQPPTSRSVFCVAPEQPTNGQWKFDPTHCSDFDASPNCIVATGVELEVGTPIVYSCDDGYKASGAVNVYCNRKGRWSNLPECITSDPLTERRTPDVQDGTQEKVSEFPWQASVYEEKNTPEGIEKQFQCVAMMIKANLLLTVPSCVYDSETKTTLDPKKLFVMAGNIYPDYDSPLHDPKIVRKSGVELLHVSCTYVRKVGESETALLQLERPLQFTANLPQPLPKVEGHTEALRDLEDRRNVFIYRTARGSVVCQNNTVQVAIVNLNSSRWLLLKIASPSDYK